MVVMNNPLAADKVESRKFLEQSLQTIEGQPDLKIDFRTVQAVYICTARGAQMSSCLRFIPHALGCTFRGDNGTCSAGVH